MSWGDARVKTLKGLLLDGYTAAQAGYVMGCSRNSVISVANRKKLEYAGTFDPSRPRRPDERKHERKPKEQRPPKKPERVAKFRIFKPSPVSLPPVPTRTVPTAANERPCSLVDLTNESCRWPHGDPGRPGFYFCGAPDADLSDGRPYCPLHAKAATRREAA